MFVVSDLAAKAKLTHVPQCQTLEGKLSAMNIQYFDVFSKICFKGSVLVSA